MRNYASSRFVQHAPHQERGAVLVVALIFLLILTLLGVTAMRMSSLETIMTGNLQESTKAFEAAESGLNKAFTASGAFDLTGQNNATFEFNGGKSNATVTTKFLQSAPPKRGSGHGTQTVDAANFDQASSGATANTYAKAVVHQGVQIIVPKSQ